VSSWLLPEGEGGGLGPAASTDGSLTSIIANGNFDGPETISLGGVYAFQANGPCTWNLVP
jgi:hypothetical protein